MMVKNAQFCDPYFCLQARTLRLLSSVYLEMDQEDLLQKALNAVTLANNVSRLCGNYVHVHITCLAFFNDLYIS